MIKSLSDCLKRLRLRRLFSDVMNKLAHCRSLKNILIFLFAKCYRVDLGIAEKKSVSDYQTFNEFFTRKLKPDARPITSNEKAIISPADGIISQLGDINNDQIFQAKGKYYDLRELLSKTRYSDKFENGKFITIYLSPKDYHRVHMPLAGKLLEMIYVPGRLLSVKPWTVKHVSRLFTRNERVVSIFETPIGHMAVVMVGALLVCGIHTVWAGRVCPNSRHGVESIDYRNQSLELAKGAEMGCFSFGSTVIVLLEPSIQATWDRAWQAGAPIQMGQQAGLTEKT